MASMLCMGLVSCTDELNISSIDPQSSPSYDVEGLLAKQYATLGLTGQKGAAGSGDLSMDEGESGFYRTIFNLQELPTDEAIWAWQTDTDIPAITNMQWNSSSVRVNWAYQRLAYDITLYNQFITEQQGKVSDDKIAEVRFLRALGYYYFLDLFRKAPFKDKFDAELPVEKSGKDLYDWIDQELTAIEPIMAEVGAYNNSANFGRADRGAAYALHARLALNSAVYTNGATKDYQKAIDYCDKILTTNAYELCKNAKNGYSGYAQVFMGDNDENPAAMKEIIFPIRQDGLKTRQYGGSTYLVNSTRGAGMPYMSTSNGWTCNFARKDLVEKFFPNDDIPMAEDADALPAGYTEQDVINKDKEKGISTADVIAKAGDDRAMFYMGVGGGIRTLSPGKQISGFLGGASIVKWSNYRTDGTIKNPGEYADVDIPLFRLAEIYLTRAEAYHRLGQDGLALSDLATVQQRAHRATSTSVDDETLIDEWAREFYMEGRRRSDLVRFGLFTGSKYLWDFKGGQPGGSGVESKYDIYPIPVNDIAGNKNMHQNAGY